MGEITVILLLALIFLGPAKLPDLATGLGKLIREFRKATSDVKNQISLHDTFRKPFEELRDAVTLHPDELKRRDQLRKSIEDIRQRLANAAATAVTVEPVTPLIPPLVETPAGAVVVTVGAKTSSDTAAPAFAARVMTSAPSPGLPRVTRPVSSLGSERSNLRQRLTAAPKGSDATAATDLSKDPAKTTAAPSPPFSHIAPPRVRPPISSLSGDRANVRQALPGHDLSPTSAPPLPPDAARVTPLPGSKKT
jgi:Sec-independent protein translocase protein TatA